MICFIHDVFANRLWLLLQPFSGWCYYKNTKWQM